MLELFYIVIKQQDLWTIYHNLCFQWGMLFQNVTSVHRLLTRISNLMFKKISSSLIDCGQYQMIK